MANIFASASVMRPSRKTWLILFLERPFRPRKCRSKNEKGASSGALPFAISELRWSAPSILIRRPRYYVSGTASDYYALHRRFIWDASSGTPHLGRLIWDASGCQCANNNVGAEHQKRDKENLSEPSLGQSISNTLTQDHPGYCGKHGAEGKNAVLDSQDIGPLQCD